MKEFGPLTNAVRIAAFGVGVSLMLFSYHRDKKRLSPVTPLPTPHPVFDIPELAENIFLNLPTRDLLRAQRVCRQWKLTIESTPSCRRALFLEASSAPRFDFNPLLVRYYGKFRLDLLNKCLSNPSASCRNMYISQPPLKFKTTSIWITIDNDTIAERTGWQLSRRHGLFQSVACRSEPDGIGSGAMTLGELAENLKVALKEENTDWDVVEVRDWGFGHDEREDEEVPVKSLFERLWYNRWGRPRLEQWCNNGLAFFCPL